MAFCTRPGLCMPSFFQKLIQPLADAERSGADIVAVPYTPRAGYPILSAMSAVSTALSLCGRYARCRADVFSAYRAVRVVKELWNDAELIAEEIVRDRPLPECNYAFGAVVTIFAGGSTEDFCRGARRGGLNCIVYDEKAERMVSELLVP